MTNVNKRLEELGFYLVEWSVNQCKYHKFFGDGRVHNVELMLLPGDGCSLVAYSTEHDEPVGLSKEQLKAFLALMEVFEEVEDND